MAASFTPQERQKIISSLKEAARKHAATTGMKKVSVEQLTEDADISKGAFYKFYASKELLFFEILDELKTEIYSKAGEALKKNEALKPSLRAAEAMLAACDVIARAGMSEFMEKDVPSLLRKIPEEMRTENYNCDEVRICMLLRGSNLIPSGGMPLAIATVRALMLSFYRKDELGNRNREVQELLIHGACRQLFPD